MISGGGSNMKKLIIGSVIVLAILLLAGFATPVSAGVEPSPFKSEINKLGSIVNNLDSINTRVELVGVVPPNDQKPGTLRGTVNRLEAMAGELERLDIRMGGVIGELPAYPQKMLEVIGAFGEVKASAQGIIGSINEYLRDPGPNDPPHEFVEALGEVRDGAQQIVSTVNEYLYGELIN